MASLSTMPDCPVTVVLPCLNEAASLPGVLAAIPAGYRALVVDNNSTEGTPEVCRRPGLDVVAADSPGYGSARPAEVGGRPQRRRGYGDRPTPRRQGTAVALACPRRDRGRVLAVAQQT